MKIPQKKALKKEKIIEMLKEELVRKDKEIEKLREENKLLLNVTYKNTKRKIEEKESTE